MEYSKHPYYKYFKHMIERGRKFGSDFTFGKEEFYRWLPIIGPIPEGMIRPTVGRYDHSKGYIFDQENNRWNFRWEELSENNRDGGKRGFKKQFELGKNPFQDGTASISSVASPNHVSKTGKSGMHTGAAWRASISSPNHVSKRVLTCPTCGYTCVGPLGMCSHKKTHE
jgi:hypothetical protein